jgi:hypothetical protein
MAARDWQGVRVGALVPLRRATLYERNEARIATTKAVWLCQCDCGARVVRVSNVLTRALKEEQALSCGCLRRGAMAGLLARMDALERVAREFGWDGEVDALEVWLRSRLTSWVTEVA